MASISASARSRRVVFEVDAPALEQASAELDQRQAQQAHGGGVAVQPALVAEAVHEARLGQQVVELAAVLLGHGVAQLVGDPLGTLDSRVAVVIEAGADPVEKNVRPLADRRVGEIEARR